jgi:Uma2 family endonuclease
LGIDIRSVSATTFQRADLEKGIEADECYYIEAAAAIRDVDDIDLAVHPPPDLAIEIDISRRSQIKLGIYAALQVREVWRYDGAVIHVLVLRSGAYEEAKQSHVLPPFPVAKAIELLEQRRALGETELIRHFRQWTQEHLFPGRDESK